jgi:hypothetical protein
MVFRRMLGLGLLALLATGCATGMHSVTGNGGGDDNGQASPAFSSETTCEGWYDRAAGACDDIGD